MTSRDIEQYKKYMDILRKRLDSKNPLSLVGIRKEYVKKHPVRVRTSQMKSKRKHEVLVESSHISRRTNVALARCLKTMRDLIHNHPADKEYYLKIRTRLEVCIRLSEEWMEKHQEEMGQKNEKIERIHEEIDKLIGVRR